MSRYCHVFHALTLMSPASKRQLQQALLVYMLGELELSTNLPEVSIQWPEKVPTLPNFISCTYLPCSKLRLAYYLFRFMKAQVGTFNKKKVLVGPSPGTVNFAKVCR